MLLRAQFLGCIRASGIWLHGRLESSHNRVEGAFMLLRDHPLMSYKGIPNWPPVWTWTRGGENKYPKGEVGTLKSVEPSKVQPGKRFFLEIDYEGSSYVACLIFDDAVF